MLLTTRLRLDADGRPHIPGSLDVWKNLFVQHPHGKYDQKLTHAASGWKDADDVIEALFALVPQAGGKRAAQDFHGAERHGPRPRQAARSRHRRPAGARLPRLRRAVLDLQRVARSHRRDRSASTWTLPASIGRIGDSQLRADAAGTMQALAGLWQILVRQGSIRPGTGRCHAWPGLIAPFAEARRRARGFRRAATTASSCCSKPQAHQRPAELSGTPRRICSPAPPPATDTDTQAQVVQDMIRVFEAQRLVSLDTLFDLADSLEAVSEGTEAERGAGQPPGLAHQRIQSPRAA